MDQSLIIRFGVPASTPPADGADADADADADAAAAWAAVPDHDALLANAHALQDWAAGYTPPTPPQWHSVRDAYARAITDAFSDYTAHCGSLP